MRRSRDLVTPCTILILLGLSLTPVVAQQVDTPSDRPDHVYWGDTHLHTYLSGDAYAMGTRITPDEAYRFARGETVRATGGGEARLHRPLDFLMVSDHAENLGVLPHLAAGDPDFLKTKDGKHWFALIKATPALSEILHAPTREQYDKQSRAMMATKDAWNGDYEVDDRFKKKIWYQIIDAAEKYNEPGRFTTFAGFEFSSNPPMLHRNVMFVGGPEQTRQTLPFSKYDSANPEDLWAYLQAYKDRVGSDVITIPHNSNLSFGKMFSPLTWDGGPMSTAYASIRASMEPVVEVTQTKGDSETHPIISPEDEFSDYERWGRYSPDADVSIVRQSYVRSALELGLALEQRLGVNPFKLGMIGSTDSHTGLSSADDDNFWGMMGANEPSKYRAADHAIFPAAGYAAVWATENTRASIFAAFKRREVYATTGPRILLRFFGGWDYRTDDAARASFADIGYRKGVPMGGDLTRPSRGQTPTFLVRAVKDPDDANLDRVQIIKGWLESDGSLHEKVIDAVWSGDRRPGADHKLPAVESTVDEKKATYTNTVGAAELSTVWLDPDFDPNQRAFYYVRVIQIPTPRWTGYDAARYGLTEVPDAQRITQERAYSSPIWYAP